MKLKENQNVKMTLEEIGGPLSKNKNDANQIRMTPIENCANWIGI